MKSSAHECTKEKMMKIALVDSTPKGNRKRMYPIALLKIGAWRKSLGDECVLFHDKLPEKGEFDAIWITTCFTFHMKHALKLAKEADCLAKHVRIGGVSATLFPEFFEKWGFDVHRGLIPEVEEVAPDYDLLKKIPKYSISYTSRGCTRKCGFCMVHKVEPVFVSYRNWIKDWHRLTKKILFYDNNWLAKPAEDIAWDIDVIEGMYKRGLIQEVDFNQALDCRLVDRDMAKQLGRIPIRPLRFAFDGPQEDGYLQRAIEHAYACGNYTIFMVFTLFNFKDTPEYLWYRLHEYIKLVEKYNIEIKCFPMRYQPVDQEDASRSYCGPHWTHEMRQAFGKILGPHSVGWGLISCTGSPGMSPLEEFYYWFGRTPEEFIELLHRPNLKKIMEKKRQDVNKSRAQIAAQRMK